MINSQKKVSIFVPSMRAGGAERSMLKLADGLAQHGCEVDLVLASAEGPHMAEISDSVRVVDLKAPRVLASLPALVRYLRRERPDALLSVLDYANIVALWARRLAGVPGRVVVNDQNTISSSSKNSARRRSRMLPSLIRRFYPWADCIIGNSQGVADDLKKVTGLPGQRIHVLYNPVVTPSLRESAKASLEHPWFGPKQPPVVLAVGRLTAQKDYPTLIEAFALLRQTRSARLLILGEGPDRSDLEALNTRLGLEQDVSLPGFVPNPYAYMSRASQFVLSSRWEGLPTVLIEALFCGPRIVSTDCPSGPREILAGGQYGRLAPVRNVDALASAMMMSLESDKSDLPEESWLPYELDTIVDQYLRILVGD